MAIPRTITAEAIITAVDKTAGAYKSAAKNIAKIEGAMLRLGANMKRVGAIMTAALTVPILAYTASAVKAFAAQEKQMNKFEMSYGKFGKTVGLSRKQLQGIA